MQTNETNEQTEELKGSVCFFCEGHDHGNNFAVRTGQQKCDCACHKK